MLSGTDRSWQSGLIASLVVSVGQQTSQLPHHHWGALTPLFRQVYLCPVSQDPALLLHCANKYVLITPIQLCNRVVTHDSKARNAKLEYQRKHNVPVDICCALLNKVCDIQGTSALRQCYTSSDYVTQKCQGSMITKKKKKKQYFLFQVSFASIFNISQDLEWKWQSKLKTSTAKQGKRKTKSCSILKTLITNTVPRQAHCSLAWIVGMRLYNSSYSPCFLSLFQMLGSWSFSPQWAKGPHRYSTQGRGQEQLDVPQSWRQLIFVYSEHPGATWSAIAL